MLSGSDERDGWKFHFKEHKKCCWVWRNTLQKKDMKLSLTELNKTAKTQQYSLSLWRIIVNWFVWLSLPWHQWSHWLENYLNWLFGFSRLFCYGITWFLCAERETKIIPLNLFKRIFNCSNRSARDEKTKKKKEKKKRKERLSWLTGWRSGYKEKFYMAVTIVFFLFCIFESNFWVT